MQIIIMYAAVFGAMWFFLIRPQKKRQTDLTNMRNALQVGDEVVTLGGIVGKVAVVKEDQVHISVGHKDEILVIEKWGIGKIKA